MSTHIDLGFRPDTYFRPQKLEKHLLSKVKGAVVRKRLQALFAEGRHAEVHELLTTEALSANDRKALEAFHPMFMGGNYLPDAPSTGGINADGVKIETADTMNAELEGKRPKQPVNWLLVASGFWSQGRYHSGHIAYFIANTGPGEWLMESVERDAELDGVTEEDVEEDRLNDDQIQAMWGMTLAEAQDAEYGQIVATCSGASADWDAKHVAAVLYRAVCKSGGKAIDEPDEIDGLLDL